jgi:hypothetical protein
MFLFYCKKSGTATYCPVFFIRTGKMKNLGASPEISSLDRKFIVLTGAIPRSEDRVTTFSIVMNLTEVSLGVWTPAFPINNRAAK